MRIEVRVRSRCNDPAINMKPVLPKLAGFGDEISELDTSGANSRAPQRRHLHRPGATHKAAREKTQMISTPSSLNLACSGCAVTAEEEQRQETNVTAVEELRQLRLLWEKQKADMKLSQDLSQFTLVGQGTDLNRYEQQPPTIVLLKDADPLREEELPMDGETEWIAVPWEVPNPQNPSVHLGCLLFCKGVQNTELPRMSITDWSHGQVGIPTFHCIRCLKRWFRGGTYPSDCEEPEDITEGPAMCITVNQLDSSSDMIVSGLVGENGKPIRIKVKEKSGIEGILEKRRRKQIRRKQKEEINRKSMASSSTSSHKERRKGSKARMHRQRICQELHSKTDFHCSTELGISSSDSNSSSFTSSDDELLDLPKPLRKQLRKILGEKMVQQSHSRRHSGALGCTESKDDFCQYLYSTINFRSSSPNPERTNTPTAADGPRNHTQRILNKRVMSGRQRASYSDSSNDMKADGRGRGYSNSDRATHPPSLSSDVLHHYDQTPSRGKRTAKHFSPEHLPQIGSTPLCAQLDYHYDATVSQEEVQTASQGSRYHHGGSGDKMPVNRRHSGPQREYHGSLDARNRKASFHAHLSSDSFKLPPIATHFSDARRLISQTSDGMHQSDNREFQLPSITDRMNQVSRHGEVDHSGLEPAEGQQQKKAGNQTASNVANHNSFSEGAAFLTSKEQEKKQTNSAASLLQTDSPRVDITNTSNNNLYSSESVLPLPSYTGRRPSNAATDPRFSHTEAGPRRASKGVVLKTAHATIKEELFPQKQNQKTKPKVSSKGRPVIQPSPQQTSVLPPLPDSQGTKHVDRKTLPSEEGQTRRIGRKIVKKTRKVKELNSDIKHISKDLGEITEQLHETTDIPSAEGGRETQDGNWITNEPSESKLGSTFRSSKETKRTTEVGEVQYQLNNFPSLQSDQKLSSTTGEQSTGGLRSVAQPTLKDRSIFGALERQLSTGLGARTSSARGQTHKQSTPVKLKPIDVPGSELDVGLKNKQMLESISTTGLDKQSGDATILSETAHSKRESDSELEVLTEEEEEESEDEEDEEYISIIQELKPISALSFSSPYFSMFPMGPQYKERYQHTHTRALQSVKYKKTTPSRRK